MPEIEATDRLPQDRPLQSGRGQLFSSPEWYLLAGLSGDAEPRFIVAREGGRVVAVLPVLTGPPRPGGSYDQQSRVLRPALGELFDPSFWQPAITVGSWNSGIYVPIGLGGASGYPPQVVQPLLEAARSIGSERDAPCVIWPFLDEPAAWSIAEASDLQALVLRSSTTWWLDTAMNEFDAYLRRFPSKRRATIRSELRRYEQSGARVQVLPTSEVREEILGMTAAHMKTHGGLSDPVAMDRLLQMQSEVFGNAALAFCSVRDGTIWSSATTISYGDTLYARSFGRRPGQGVPFEYFVVSYYEPILYCIRMGLKWLHVGAGSSEAKALRGGEAQQLWTVVLTPHSLPSAVRRAVAVWNAEG